MATKKKKKKSEKMPSVPSYQSPQITEPREVSVPREPMSINDYTNAIPQIISRYLSMQPEITASDVARQKALMGSAFEEQERQLPISAYNRAQLDATYLPQYTSLYGTALSQANPQFMPTYNQLGAAVRADLGAGYDLGPGLTQEIEQGIRGGQTARGNWLGAAPTAAEAFGKGSAAVGLRNMRIGAAQQFIQGKQPTDMWGALQAARPVGQTIAPIYPQQDYIGQASSAFGTVQQGLSAYNATSVDAQSSYNSAMGNYNNALISNAGNAANFGFEGYDRSLDQWLYKESVKQGLYSTPSYASGGGGGGGMMSGMGGNIIKGVGGGLMAGLGSAAAGASIAGLGVGGTALATGAAAAVSAAGAAICWLARRCIPDRWKEWQAYLFTDAPESLRRAYIYKAKRIAAAISDSEAARIRVLMERILA